MLRTRKIYESIIVGVYVVSYVLMIAQASFNCVWWAGWSGREHRRRHKSEGMAAYITVSYMHSDFLMFSLVTTILLLFYPIILCYLITCIIVRNYTACSYLVRLKKNTKNVSVRFR
jgi:hypothetical protein